MFFDFEYFNQFNFDFVAQKSDDNLTKLDTISLFFTGSLVNA